MTNSPDLCLRQKVNTEVNREYTAAIKLDGDWWIGWI